VGVQIPPSPPISHQRRNFSETTQRRGVRDRHGCFADLMKKQPEHQDTSVKKNAKINIFKVQPNSQSPRLKRGNLSGFFLQFRERPRNPINIPVT
jgi:hypothetical protein